MKKSVEAIYEDGVFRPLEPVVLPEHQRVQVTVADEDEWLDRDYIQWAASQVQETVSLDDVPRRSPKSPSHSPPISSPSAKTARWPVVF
jgi:predicted DNA-binding antitoxin AbrB/MazE fold protein